MKLKCCFTSSLIALILSSCATPPQVSAVYTHLTPVHPETLETIDGALGKASLLDNDGNMYSTVWMLGSVKEDVFAEKVKVCDQQVKDRMLFSKFVELNDINESTIQPTLFKEHAQCIASQGFRLKGREGFLPEKYRLSIYRGHSKAATYMPVGVTYSIAKKGASYLDVYRHVSECTLQVKNTKDGGVIEDYTDNSIHVSIEPYANFIENCLSGYGYSIEISKY